MEGHERSVGFQLRELHIYIKRYIESQDMDDEFKNLRGPQMWTLGYLHHHQHQSIFQKDIEENLSIRKSTASKLIERMLKNGFIDTFASAEDRRMKEIRITQKGVDLLNHAHHKMKQMEEALCKNLSEEEIDQLLTLIAKMKQGIRLEE